MKTKKLYNFSNFETLNYIWLASSSFSIFSALNYYGIIIKNDTFSGGTFIENILFLFKYYYMADRSISQVLNLAFVIYFVHKSKKYMDKNPQIRLYSFLNAALFIAGKSYMQKGNLTLVTESWINLFTSLIALYGYFTLFNIIISYVVIFLKQYKFCPIKSKNLLISWVFETHPFLGCSFVLFLLWLPYIICYYPGILQYDGYEQIKMYYGYRIWTTHHPAFSTLLMGILMDFGKSLSSGEVGVFLYTFPQCIAMILTFAYGFVYLKRWNIPVNFRIIFLGIIGLIPIFPMYAYTEIKDSLSYLLSMWFLYLLLDINEKFNYRTKIPLCIVTTLLCLVRNEMKIVFLLFIIVLLIKKNNISKNWINLSRIIVLGVIIAILGNFFLCMFFDIKKGSLRESMSIPAQQTARYIRKHKNDITEDEWILLNEIFEDADKLGEIYEPDKADAVKGKMKSDITIKQLLIYGKVWIKELFNDPLIYLSAFFNSTYGYFYLERPEYYGYGYATDNINSDMSNFNENICIKFIERFESGRNIIQKWMELLRFSPLTNWLYHPGTYISIFTFTLWLLCYFKCAENIFIYIMPIIILLVCCLSPINGSIRYSLSIICGLPIFLSNVIAQIICNNNKKQIKF